MPHSPPSATLPYRKITFSAASKFKYETLAALMTEAFADYLAGPIRIDAALFEAFIKAYAVEHELSLVAEDEGHPVGLILVGRRHTHWRVATMGVIPAHRKLTLGRGLLTRIIEHARRKKCEELQLEVFEQNSPAVALYQSMGFVQQRRLHGWSIGGPSRSVDQAPLVTLLEAPVSVASNDLLDFPELPWQNSPWGACLVPQPLRLVQTTNISIAIQALDSESPILRSAFVTRDIAFAELTSVLHALRTQYPDKQWIAPAFWPEEFNAAFEAAGFVRTELSQIQMSLRLG